MKLFNNKNTIKTIAFSTIGTVIESYDLLLYINLLPTLSANFFADNQLFSSIIIIIVLVSLTLVMRPVGSIYFGFIGDRFGRNRGLFESIIYMIIPTFIIGVLPTYDQIYIAAPIILIICRLIQSFAMGGEVGGTNTILAECSIVGLECTITSLLPSAIMLGGALSSIITYCINYDLFSWRCSFLIGAFFGIVSFYFRYKTFETKQFKDCFNNRSLLEYPFIKLIQDDLDKVLCSFLMTFGTVVPFHLNYVYMSNFLGNMLNISNKDIVFFNIITQMTSVFLVPLFAYLADKTDKKLIMCTALVILIALSYPLIIYNNYKPSIFCSHIIQVTLCISVSLYSGPFYSSVALLFSVNRRFTASGFSISLGIAGFSFFSSLFIWATYENNLFLYTGIPMILFCFLNVRMILRNIR